MNYKRMTKADLIKELENAPKTNISNNVFNTKIWDEKAIIAVNDIAKALLNMTELFKSGDISVTGINIKGDQVL